MKRVLSLTETFELLLAVLPCVWGFDSVKTPTRIPLIFRCAKQEGPWGGGGVVGDRYANTLKDKNDYHSGEVLFDDAKAVL